MFDHHVEGTASMRDILLDDRWRPLKLSTVEDGQVAHFVQPTFPPLPDV